MNDDFGLMIMIFVLFVNDGNILRKSSVHPSLVLLSVLFTVMNIHRTNSSVKVKPAPT